MVQLMLNSSTNGFMESLLTDCRNLYVIPNKQLGMSYEKLIDVLMHLLI